MKKIVLFFVVVIVIISTFTYFYLNQVANYNIAKRENSKFRIFENEEISGLDLATIINKALNENVKNEVEKDDDGKYIDNKNNSINIDIEFLDDDVIYNIEKIYAGGIENFVKYYSEITFKCMEIKYHEQTKKISYMKFEQITQ